jgi:Tol biopolymer transport system component
MRTLLLVALAGFTLAQTPEPQKIVFARVFPQPGQIGLFIAAADGTGERPLVSPADIDYDAAWAQDGASIVFTSERNGSAICIASSRTAAGSSDSPTAPRTTIRRRSLQTASASVFVSTRGGGTADLWTLDLEHEKGKSADVRSGRRFPPSWSPDGQWIAFSSDRASTCRSRTDAGNICNSPISTSCIPMGRR